MNVVPAVPATKPILGRPCYCCHRVTPDALLERCEVCRENICSDDDCSGRCRCDLVNLGATEFSQNIDHLKDFSNREVYLYTKDENLKFTSCSKNVSRDVGAVIGLTSSQLHGKIGGISEAYDEQVIKTRKSVEFVQPATIKGKTEYFLTRKFPIVKDDGRVWIAGRSVKITDLVESSERALLV